MGDKNITIFTHPANTCTCHLKVYRNKEHKGVIYSMISLSNSSQSTRPVGRVLWEELPVLSGFYS